MENTTAAFCANCGNALEEGQRFCASCGHSVTPPVSPEEPAPEIPVESTPEVPKKKKKKKVGLIIGIVAAVVAVAMVIVLVVGTIIAAITGTLGLVGLGVLFSGDTGPDLEEIYNDHCQAVWADIASDGTYLIIDTNPYDWEDDGAAYMDAYYAIETINQELGLPSYLFEDMGTTTSLDGKQTETFEDQGIIVSWRYHPDRGLEVTYKKIR